MPKTIRGNQSVVYSGLGSLVRFAEDDPVSAVAERLSYRRLCAAISRLTQHADRLRPLLEMAQATRRYYDAVPEAPGGLAAGRDGLISFLRQ